MYVFLYVFQDSLSSKEVKSCKIIKLLENGCCNTCVHFLALARNTTDIHIPPKYHLKHH